MLGARGGFDRIRGFLAMTIVEILVLKGAVPSSVAITSDVLETANRLCRTAGRSPAFAVRLSGSGAVAASAFVGGRLAGDEPRGDPDIVIVPGLGLTNEDEVAEGLARRDAADARRRLVAAVEAGAEIATSCSGTFLLASAGLLDGRSATTSWWLAPLFRRLYPEVRLDTRALVVKDGSVVTAGAAMAQLDLMLSVVARHGGSRLADGCARYLLLDERRSQSRYMALSHLAGADERVAQAERWARNRLERPCTVDDLAAAAGLTPRTFARRVSRATGLSPIHFLQRLRIERAVELMETTKLPFEEIARRVGYAEPSTLRRLIRRDGGINPRELRGALSTAAVE
jgi:transcriptional regulator GlxA family with amidase domain